MSTKMDGLTWEEALATVASLDDEIAQLKKQIEAPKVVDLTTSLTDIATDIGNLADVMYRFPSTVFQLKRIKSKVDRLAAMPCQCGLVCHRPECGDTNAASK